MQLPMSCNGISDFSRRIKNIGSKYFPHKTRIMSFAPLYFFIFLHQLTVLVAANDSTPPYRAVEDIALDCGSGSNATAPDKRFWIRDTNSSLITLEHSNNLSNISTAPRQPLSGEQIPYLTARLSYSQFTYSFAVSAGQKFIRLHFYSTSYPSFENARAFFSVKAGRFTLLNNFTAAAVAVDGLDVVRKEFCVNVEKGDKLNITFIPSSAIADAYAFINGIEIVSMPTNLYYTASDVEGVKIIGMENMFFVRNDTALETTYRVNVGGSSISPRQDTGMYRSWSSEEQYLTVAGTSFSITNLSIELNFKKIRNYTAPESVYKSARSMGLNRTINENYYLTWGYPVDSGFTYLVRLHFCEFQVDINQTSAREFQIFIANQIAEDAADVFFWGDGNGSPVIRDYAVVMGNTGPRTMKQNLTIQLHTADYQNTLYSDAILNGIEIFKTNNSAGDLAGINPNIPPLSPPVVSPLSPSSTNKNRRAMFAIIGGAIFCILLLSLLLFFIFQRRTKAKYSGSSDGASWWDPFISSTGKSAKTQGSTLPSDLCRCFSLAEIKEATNNFDSVFIIGVGGFGNVYKGIINDGAISVAIKRLNPGSEQGANEFKTEIEMLSQLRYLHLVSLIGYCCEDGEMILVYDYMARGTLRDHLYKTDNPPLPWIQRLEICIGAACGLQYLHSGAKNTIIHRDVKTTNILLDEKWVAKVSDFGLSKIGPNSMSKPHISTVVKGSFGYLDPEYYRLQRLTEKSDVYSFGVVLCEVLSARPPVSKSSFNKPVSLAEWARQCYRKGTLDDIVEPYLKGKIAPDCLKKFSELAVSCLLDNGTDRPSMSDVVWGLEFALQLQETAVQQGRLQTEIDISNAESPLMKGSFADDSSDNVFSSGSALVIGSRLSGMTLTSSSDDQSFLSNSSDQKVMSGAVFSQIMNPKGR